MSVPNAGAGGVSSIGRVHRAGGGERAGSAEGGQQNWGGRGGAAERKQGRRRSVYTSVHSGGRRLAALRRSLTTCVLPPGRTRDVRAVRVAWLLVALRGTQTQGGS